MRTLSLGYLTEQLTILTTSSLTHWINQLISGVIIHEDSTVIIAAPAGGVASAIETVLVAALGAATDETAGTPTPDPLVP